MKLFKYIVLSCFFSSYLFGATTEKPIVLVSTSYNNSQWYKKNLDAAFAQNYSNWRMIYIDDCSPDGTGDLVEQYIKQNGWEDKVTLIKNKDHKLKVENFYIAVHQYCDDDEIVIDYDGDDFLANEDVLSKINQAYSSQEVWLTYGSYVTWPQKTKCCCKLVPQEVIEQNSYRNFPWVFSHLKSFYAWLFKKIDAEDLKYKGEFLDMAGDLAFMYPMLEMSGGRFKFIKDILYLYNRANPINDDKKNVRRQRFLDRFLRRKKRYNALPEYFQSNFDKAMDFSKNYQPEFAEIKEDWKKVKDLYDQHIIINPSFSEQTRIPKIIHQIWLGSVLPEKYKTLQETWKKNHPDWEYKLWTDKEVEEFGLINKQHYDETSNYGARSDIARYEILHRFGGLYVDTDFECTKPFDALNHSCDFYTGIAYDSDVVFFIGLIGSVPGHPILERCIYDMKRKIKIVENGVDIMTRTGPYFFTNCFFKAVDCHDGPSVAFPVSYFYPWPAYDRKNNSYENIYSWVRPETFGIHHWHVSWLKN